LKTCLFLAPRFPWPLVGGDRVKSYHILRMLADRYKVHLVTFNHGSAPAVEQRQAIEALGIALHTIPLVPWKAALGSSLRLGGRMPLEISFYNRPEFASVVNSILDRQHVDLAIAFFMRTAEYIRHRSGIPKILIAEDCRQLYQQRSMSSTRSPVQHLVRRFEVQKLRDYEPNVVMDFDVTTFVSLEDIEAMQSTQPRGSYALLSNGVNLDEFSFGTHNQRQGLLFHGKLNVEANHLMAMRIINRILPALRELRSDVALTIVGAYPRTALLRAMHRSNVEFVENPASVIPYLHSSQVYVHPHQGGSGIQNKVLEAMATGCAVATTRTGLQGIEAISGTHALVADDDFGMVKNIALLLEDHELRQTLTERARKLIEETKSWQTIRQQFDKVLEQVEVKQL